MAGIAGLHPDPYTFAELCQIAEARATHDWDQTALLWATLSNTWRNKETPPANPGDVHPFRAPEDYTNPEKTPEEHLARRLAMLPPEQRATVAAWFRKKQQDTPTHGRTP